MPTEAPWGQQATSYHAREDRRMTGRLPLQPGVVAPADLKVTPVSGMTLQVAAGKAWVQGSHAGITRQGLYNMALAAADTVTVGAAHATLPRIDQVVLRVRDTAPAPGSAADAENTGKFEVVAGTATAGATLANLTGAATLPASSLLLAYVLVPAAFTGPFVAATHLLDARPAALVGTAPGAVVAYRNAAHTLTVGAFAKVPMDAVEEDAWGWFDITTNVGRYTPRSPGLYQLQTRVRMNNTTDGVWLEVAILKNGTRIASRRASNGDPTDSGVDVTTIARANGSTDFFEVHAQCEGARAVVTGRETTAFEAFQIGV